MARELLEKAVFYQEVKKRGKYYYYRFDAIIRNKKVSVVVSSKGKKGRKTFLSFFSRPVK